MLGYSCGLSEGENAGLFRSNVSSAKVCRAYYLAHSSIGWTETKGPPSKITPTFRDRELTEKRDLDVPVHVRRIV